MGRASAPIPCWWHRSRSAKDANTGAGSVITKDVPAGALAVERAEQRNVEGYRKRKDAEHRATGKGKS